VVGIILGRMRRILELALLGAVVVLLLSRCNTPMRGKDAPALDGEAWLPAAAAPAEPDQGWRLLAFFSPT
jgi:hypothetical protein